MSVPWEGGTLLCSDTCRSERRKLTKRGRPRGEGNRGRSGWHQRVVSRSSVGVIRRGSQIGSGNHLKILVFFITADFERRKCQELSPNILRILLLCSFGAG